MPGIAGFLKTQVAGNEAEVLERMLSRLKHNPSQPSGTCPEPQLRTWVSWVGREAAQSMVGCCWNTSRTACLVMCGEMFADAPHLGRSLGSPDILKGFLAEYEERGPSFLRGINGRFAGLVIDCVRKHVLLFNDRFGLGRLYWSQSAEGLFFSSEAKSLLLVLPQARVLDEQGIAEWLSCGCVLENRTLFCGIGLLPPGSVWTFDAAGCLTKGRYFDGKEWESQESLAPREYYERLRGLFPQVLKRYAGGDDPIAMSLTGGLDGRMIMSWCPRKQGQLPCYTFNGPVRECADLRIAKRIARECGQEHHTIEVAEQFFKEFSSLAEQTVYLSDGAMDASGAVEVYANRLARQIAPVRLTGNYGSEILRGNIAFKPRPLNAELFIPELICESLDAKKRYREQSRGNRLSFIAFKQVPWHHFSRLSVEQSQLQIRSPFLDNDLVALAFQSSPENLMSLEPSLRLIAEGRPNLARIPTDRGVTFQNGTLLSKGRRAFHEFAARAEYAYDYGMPDWLARLDSLFGVSLERFFLGRQKFCHFRSWYRTVLAASIKEMLLDRGSYSRGYVKGGTLEPMLSEHTAGRRNWTLEIHKLVSLELIHRTLLQ